WRKPADRLVGAAPVAAFRRHVMRRSDAPLSCVHVRGDLAVMATRFGGDARAGRVCRLRADPAVAATTAGAPCAGTARDAEPAAGDAIRAGAGKACMVSRKCRARVHDCEIPLRVLAHS
ncbi:MAG: hypothetical protein ACU85V_15220, partial [Gammaproteobacteria bacterium]